MTENGLHVPAGRSRRAAACSFTAGNRRVRVRRTKSVSFPLSGYGSLVVRVPAGGARDRYGNTNAAVATVQP